MARMFSFADCSHSKEPNDASWHPDGGLPASGRQAQLLPQHHIKRSCQWRWHWLPTGRNGPTRPRPLSKSIALKLKVEILISLTKKRKKRLAWRRPIILDLQGGIWTVKALRLEFYFLELFHRWREELARWAWFVIRYTELGFLNSKVFHIDGQFDIAILRTPSWID